ncbi:MAG: xanthine phosphoribosyltransferase [Veillonellaceae bacterium]|nr:xanthine phosphoribosyltransferase [Veillonellaceae bacterium]
MQLLKDRIDREGSVIDNRILKVDSFLNQQIDADLFMEMGKEFASRVKGKKIDRVVTIEASGIAVALPIAYFLNVPLVFARKKKSLLMNEEVYHEEIYSYTKEENYEISISKRFLPEGEHVLLVDDFLASGEAAMGLAHLVEQAGETVEAIGIVIEKSFQPGRGRLEDAGYDVQSLVRIEKFEDNKCVYINE